MSTFPDMLYEFGGAPVSGSRYSSPWNTHYFVDTATGSNANTGFKPTEAKATIDAAVQIMSRGDVLYIRPGLYVLGTGMTRYTECATIDVAQSDLSIIGAGFKQNSEFGARMKATSTEVQCMLIDGPAAHIENLHFFGDGTATYTIFARNYGTTYVGGNGLCLYNCNFKGALTRIQGGQATRVINCVFNNAAGELNLASSDCTGLNQQVVNCDFLDTAQQTAPTHPQLGQYDGANVVDLRVHNCRFGKIPTTTAYYINFSGTNCTGIISQSYFNTVNLDTDTDVVLGSTFFYMSGCYDKTGLVSDAND